MLGPVAGTAQFAHGFLKRVGVCGVHGVFVGRTGMAHLTSSRRRGNGPTHQPEEEAPNPAMVLAPQRFHGLGFMTVGHDDPARSAAQALTTVVWFLATAAHALDPTTPEDRVE